MYIDHSLENHFESLIAKITTELGLTPNESLRVSAAPVHTKADFATNWPLVVFTQLDLEKKQELGVTSPFSLAEILASKLTATTNGNKPNSILSATAAKPGFINIIATDQALAALLPIVADETEELVPQENKGKKVVVEFGDPNPFKEFHIGHLFTTIAGETISRLLAATGATANRVCYQGDVGMHVAKSLWGVQHLFKQENLDLETVGTWELNKSIAFLGRSYAAGATAFETSEEAKEAMKKINFLGYKAGQERLVKEQNFTPIIDYSQFVSAEDD
ncbi:MAG: arginine--tRNA ligase, partial [Candidatus Pacebacteria bacterium CG_4_10_14_0_8_um_filter_42_14]